MARIAAVHPSPQTSAPGKGHRISPYLLRKSAIVRPYQVWCADITYILMPAGYCYLVVVMDWHSRKVPGWAVSTTVDTEFCLQAFRQAVMVAGSPPEIMNTDQGSQFASDDRIAEMKKHSGPKISMDGTGRWVDNVFIERLWWSLKYEHVYLRSYETPWVVGHGFNEWFGSYNADRPHSALEDATPDEVYFDGADREAEAVAWLWTTRRIRGITRKRKTKWRDLRLS